MNQRPGQEADQESLPELPIRSLTPFSLTNTFFVNDSLNRLDELYHWVDENGDSIRGTDEIRALFDYSLRGNGENDVLADGKRTGVDETLWDADGNVVSQSSFDWQYDDAGRLIQEIASSTDFEDYTLTWQYDRTGNRLQQIKTPVNSDIESTIYTYDANDRLNTETKTVGSVQTATTYTFDKTQQTSKVVTTNGQSTTYNYQYDLQGRMSAVITDKPGESSSKVTYQYDSNGNRVATEEFIDANGNGTFEASEIVKRTEYLTDSENHTGYSQVLQETEFDANGIAVKKTIYSVGHDQISQTVFNRVDTDGDGTPDAWDSGQTDYFGTDGHGSVRVLYDLAAAIVQDVQNNLPQIYHFDAYGNLLNFDTATPLTNYLYSGEAFDFNIGQQYLRARWYDASNGRFNRLDPYFGNSSDPQSFHKYAYVHGDPISNTDPTGEFSFSQLLAGFSIGAAGYGALTGGILGAFTSAVDEYLGTGRVDKAIVAGVFGGVVGAGLGAVTGGFGGPLAGALSKLTVGQAGALLRFLFVGNIAGTIYGVSTAENTQQAGFRGALGIFNGITSGFGLKLLQAQKDKIVNTLTRLSIDHEQGRPLLIQGLGGFRLEKFFGRKVTPGTTDGVDFIVGSNEIVGKKIQLKGPFLDDHVQPLGRSPQQIANDINPKIRNNTAADEFVIDTLGLTAAEADQLEQLVETAGKKVTFIRNTNQ